MELCLDNPREGFADLFATHPSVESRVQALVRYAGGHYIGPLALPKPPSEAQQNETDQSESGQLPPPLSSGPWGSPTPPRQRRERRIGAVPHALGQPGGHSLGSLGPAP